ncbi:MAG: hypothetical protein LBV16_06960 [Elusimicrobiota bacterium]|nr:hypothetical protein [Elusimicrobiota bacterium]
MENEEINPTVEDGAIPQETQSEQTQVEGDAGKPTEVNPSKNALQLALEKAQKEIDDKDAEEQKAKQKGADGKQGKAQPKKDGENKDDDKTKTDDGKTPKVQDKGGKQEFAPQEHWTDEQKEFFNGLEPQNQKKVLDMYKGIQKVYEKKTLDLSKQQKSYEQFNKAFEPYEDIFKKQNIDKGAYIKQMIDLDRQATANPVEFAIKFMQSRGLNLDHIIAGIQQMSSPEYQHIAPLKQKLESLQKQIESETSNKESVKFEGLIEEFKNETDESGNLAHPYFDEVQEQMAQISTATGETDLAKIYEQALWTTPEVRAKLIEAEKQKVAQAKQKEDQAKKTQAAAGLHIKNSAAPANPPKKQGLRSIIEELDGE